MKKGIILSEDKIEKIIFCPKCRVILRDDRDYKYEMKLVYEQKRMFFTCRECLNTDFSKECYKNNSKSKKKFSLGGNQNRSSIIEYFKKKIIELKKKNYSNALIYDKTCIPRHIINKETTDYFSLESEKKFTLKDFLLNELDINNELDIKESIPIKGTVINMDIYTRIINKEKLPKYIKEYFIIKAIKYGLGRDFIRKVIPIKTDEISKLHKKFKKDVIIDKELFKTYLDKRIKTVILENDVVTIRYRNKKKIK